MTFRASLKPRKIAASGVKAFAVIFFGWLGWGLLDSILNKEALIKSLSKISSIIWNIKVPNILIILVLIIIFCTLMIYGRRFKGLSLEKFEEMLADNRRMQRHNDQLVEQMNNFYTNYNKLSKEDRGVLDKIKPLVDHLLQSDAIIENNAVWLTDKLTSLKEGPFCLRCHEVDNKFVHMLESKTVYNCPICDLDIEKKIQDLTEEHYFILTLLAAVPDKSSGLADIIHEYERKYNKNTSYLNLILNKLNEYRFIKEIEYGDLCAIGYEIRPEGMKFLEECLKNNFENITKAE